MTTVANIKGYINGEEWGVYEPTPSLLTYEQLIALTQTEAVTELNAHAEDYYTSLNDGGHIYKHIKVGTFVGLASEGLYNFDTHTYDVPPAYMSGGIKYNNGTFIAD